MSTASGERLAMLHESRRALYTLPCGELFELPGRPNVIYMIKDYSKDKIQGALDARSEVPFLFKAFETGQIGPRRLARMAGERPRTSTIHEYLDWTVTALESSGDGEYDFSGFRLLLLYPRERSLWPSPSQNQAPTPRAHPVLGAPKDPWPALHVKGKPLSAATIRTGPGYIEVPFVATHEAKRGRGFGKCVVEAVEEVARALGISRLLLCSTQEEQVMATWHHLGFHDCTEQQMEDWGVQDSDLVHMQNTVQMHKQVPPPRRWKPIVVRHQAFVARTYMALDQAPATSKSGLHGVRPLQAAVSGFGFRSSFSGMDSEGPGGTSQALSGHRDEGMSQRMEDVEEGEQEQQAAPKQQQQQQQAAPLIPLVAPVPPDQQPGGPWPAVVQMDPGDEEGEQQPMEAAEQQQQEQPYSLQQLQPAVGSPGGLAVTLQATAAS